MTFTDYETAFGSVDTAAGGEALRGQGVEGTYIGFLEELYKSTTTGTIIVCKSEKFPVWKGVRQAGEDSAAGTWTVRKRTGHARVWGRGLETQERWVQLRTFSFLSVCRLRSLPQTVYNQHAQIATLVRQADVSSLKLLTASLRGLSGKLSWKRSHGYE